MTCHLAEVCCQVVHRKVTLPHLPLCPLWKEVTSRGRASAQIPVTPRRCGETSCPPSAAHLSVDREYSTVLGVTTQGCPLLSMSFQPWPQGPFHEAPMPLDMPALPWLGLFVPGASTHAGTGCPGLLPCVLPPRQTRLFHPGAWLLCWTVGCLGNPDPAPGCLLPVSVDEQNRCVWTNASCARTSRMSLVM